MPDVVHTCPLSDAIEQELHRHFGAELVPLRGADRTTWLSALTGTRARVVPGDPVDRDLSTGLPDTVTLIASYPDLDHVDVDAAASRGIEVTSTPDVLTNATATNALLLIVATLRGVAPTQRLLRDRRWKG